MGKVAFVGVDSSIRREFMEQAPEWEIESAGAGDVFRLQPDLDLILIAEQEVSISDLEPFMANRHAKQVGYLLSSHCENSILENKASVCTKLGILPIFPRQTPKQMVRMLLGTSGKTTMARKRLVIMGTHPQTGATMIALCLARELSARGVSVGVLGLNSDNPGNHYFHPYNGNTLDEYYPEIADSRRLPKRDELLNFMHKDEHGYAYLAGNADFTKRRYYRFDCIERLIDMASDIFDLVILDAGCSPDSNLTLQALAQGDIKLLVGSQQPLSEMMWNRMYTDILRLLSYTKDEFLLVINRHMADLPLEGRKLQQLMGVPLVGEIPDFGLDGLLCEIENRLLTDSGNRSARKRALACFSELADIVMDRMGGRADKLKKERGLLWTRSG
ncbi:hypothetical protein [Gorillibacterium massiliense]|uniref:hypothetical protein n=1 Tax=Gorillibacterium massiliense TaxID=1280390 RepID=UPI0004B1AA48|nr:hypothetical protein [Gorillibacterium massiliense]